MDYLEIIESEQTYAESEVLGCISDLLIKECQYHLAMDTEYENGTQHFQEAGVVAGIATGIYLIPEHIRNIIKWIKNAIRTIIGFFHKKLAKLKRSIHKLTNTDSYKNWLWDNRMEIMEKYRFTKVIKKDIYFVIPTNIKKYKRSPRYKNKPMSAMNFLFDGANGIVSWPCEYSVKGIEKLTQAIKDYDSGKTNNINQRHGEYPFKFDQSSGPVQDNNYHHDMDDFANALRFDADRLEDFEKKMNEFKGETAKVSDIAILEEKDICELCDNIKAESKDIQQRLKDLDEVMNSRKIESREINSTIPMRNANDIENQKLISLFDELRNFYEKYRKALIGPSFMELLDTVGDYLDQFWYNSENKDKKKDDNKK